MLDTGSITRPMYAYASKEMNKLRGGFPDVHYLVLYVREAHPGARTKGGNSVQEKRQNAQSACLLHHEKKNSWWMRWMAMPNMLYVIDTDGTVKFRANWPKVNALKNVLANLDKIETKNYYEVVQPPLGLALRTLLIGGFGALYEFVINLPQLLKQHKEAGSI